MVSAELEEPGSWESVAPSESVSLPSRHWGPAAAPAATGGTAGGGGGGGGGGAAAEQATCVPPAGSTVMPVEVANPWAPPAASETALFETTVCEPLAGFTEKSVPPLPAP